MPFAALLLALDAAFIVHAAKTGRFTPWAYIILALPGLGALAYAVVEILPAWRTGHQGQLAAKKIAYAVTPLKIYNILRDELATSDTVYNRVALARECMVLERNEEALVLLQEVVVHPQGDEPKYYFDKALVEFKLSRPNSTMETLEELKRRWPDWKSGDAHLLYARAAEAAGLSSKALEEYGAVSQYYLGAEAPVRHALYLQNLGREEEAKSIAQNVVTILNRAPRHVQKEQAKWKAEAKKILASGPIN